MHPDFTQPVNPNAPDNLEYFVAETFDTIQGEGITIGCPSFFIRLQFCPVGCNWCDTKYTWEVKSSNYPPKSPLDIYNLWRTGKTRPHNIVITGGEPLYHELSPLISQFRTGSMESGVKAETENLLMQFSFEIETSCVVPPSPELMKHAKGGYLRFNCSPKLVKSGAKMMQQSQAGIPNFIFDDTPDDFGTRMHTTFKFVCEDESDVAEVLPLCDKYSIPYSWVYLMPQALRREELQSRSEWLVERCKELGFNFSTRLHLQLWGPKRGV